MAIKLNIVDNGTSTSSKTSTQKQLNSIGKSAAEAARKAAAEAARKAEEERQRKIKEIKEEIATLENKLEEWKQKKEDYITLKGNVNSAKSQLESAKENVATAKRQFENAYEGNRARACKANMETEISEISVLIGKLNNIVLPAINTKIEKIKEQIIDMQKRIRGLETTLKSL